MYGGKRTPARWLYGLAALIPLLACLGSALVVYQSVPKLPGALETMGIDNLTQVVVPGSADIYFPKAGAYAVYYEYRSVFDGVKYIRSKYPPRLNCRLESKASGADVAVVSNYIEGNMYTTQNQERAGVLINTITIEKPGRYTFDCQYPYARTSPEIVLAVGPNLVWEFFNLAARPLAATVVGALVFSGALGMSVLIVGLVAYKRRQSKAPSPQSG